MEKKKIVGLSTGRKNGNSETLLKAALMKAETLGVETEIIRAMDHDIRPCTGCETCSMAMARGKTPRCAVKDDVPWILEKTVVEDCALIVSAPVYHLIPNGHLLVINQRMLPTLFRNPRVLEKTRVGGIISVGGGEPEWTPLGLLNANIFMQHTRILVDQFQANYCGRPMQVMAFDDYLERAERLGENVARAAMMPPEAVLYMGDDFATCCPVCHCNVLQVPARLPEVVCPVCDVHGVVTGQGEEMAVVWRDEDVQTPRFSPRGVKVHADYIARNAEKFYTRDQEKVQALKGKYVGWGNFASPSTGH